MNYGAHVSRKQTPQSEPIPGTAQVANNAGGFVFHLDDWKRLERFLVLGSEGGTYYVREQKLTRDNAAAVERCLSADPARAVSVIAAISDAGRAPKNDPAIFALALAVAMGGAARAEALKALSKVCRIPTHLFQLVAWVNEIHPGLGARSYRSALARWYTSQTPDRLAYQITKYQSRHGWTHRDVLRVAHPKADGVVGALLGYARAGVKGREEYGVTVRTKGGEVERRYPETSVSLPRIIEGVERARGAAPKEVAALVREYGLTHEMVPSESLALATTWEALLEKMPLHAMVRNLGRMTSLGLIGPLSAAARNVVERLASGEEIRKSRLHPMAILVALKTYAQGCGDKGSLTWAPEQSVVSALDAAFYLAFENVEPTGKAHFLAVDISGSMGQAQIAGSPLTARDAAAALTLVTVAREPNCAVFGFTNGGIAGGKSQHYGYQNGLTQLQISPRQRLDDVIRYMSNLPMGGTDCALPFLAAAQLRVNVDAFVTMTDSETWAGNIHPVQALKAYRNAFNPEARSVVVGMTATEFTIGDPADPLSLDVVGFDTSTPAAIADFVRG